MDEILSKLVSLQEINSLLKEEQNNSFKFLANSMKEIKIKLQNLEEKMDSIIRSTQILELESQTQSIVIPNL